MRIHNFSFKKKIDGKSTTYFETINYYFKRSGYNFLIRGLKGYATLFKKRGHP